jgi:hypothetical protein
MTAAICTFVGNSSISANINSCGSAPQQLPTAVNTAGNVLWVITRPSNSLFVGCSGIMTTIEESIQQRATTEQLRFVITGIGGQGKSEICLQLANRVRSQ